GQRRPVAPGLSRTPGGGPRGARGYPGARVVLRHAHGRTLGGVGHQSADGAAVGSGREGGRRPRRASRPMRMIPESGNRFSENIMRQPNGPLTILGPFDILSGKLDSRRSLLYPFGPPVERQT